MSYLAGMLWLDDDEVFNNGRTLANMVAARAAGTLPPNFHFPDEADCDCAAYNLIPTQETGPFTTLLACLPACFDEDNLNQIVVANPWYDADDFASTEFLGVWVYDVTGLDGRHNARTTTPRGAFPRGSILSPLTPAHRTITYDIALVATSTCGLDYGMQWLEQQLASSACAGCELQTMTIRSCCPPDNDPEYGIWQFKEVGLGEGPEWSEPLDSRMAKYVRDGHVSFFAGNPCRFSKPEECLGWTKMWIGGPFFTDSASAVFSCCAIPAEAKTYSTAPIITLESNVNGRSFPFVLFAIPASTVATACTEAANLAASDGSIDVPDTPPFFLPVASIPGDSRLIIDAALREIRFANADTSWVEVDGSAYIDASEGAINWGLLSCGDPLALVMAVDGSDLADAFIAYNTGDTSQFYSPPRIRCDLVRRGGC